MAQLVLLVVAAAWAAVLIPPMLRSRIDNRPNSSVTDFRRQLNKLQSTANPTRGRTRVMGRPLAPSPLTRSAAAGRPGQTHHRQAHLHIGAPGRRSHYSPVTAPPDELRRAARAPEREFDERQQDARQQDARQQGARQHGARHTPDRERHTPGRERRHGGFRTHGDPSGAVEHPHHRQAHVHQHQVPAQPADVKRRRTNVLFVLVITTACTLFLAATTTVTFMVYAFALSFLALCGYIFLLAQLRQRETAQWNDGWFERR